MAALNVSAVIHPADHHFLLVSVEGAGGPVDELTEHNFRVACWASGTFTPGGAVTNNMSMAVAAVEPLFDPSSVRLFYQVQVRDPVHEPAPVPLSGPLVFMVSVTSGSDSGQAIACPCESQGFPPG